MYKSGKEKTGGSLDLSRSGLVALALLALSCVFALSGSSTVAAGKEMSAGSSASSGVPATQKYPASPAQPATAITIRGHVLLAGRPGPPDPRWVIVVTATLASATGTCLDFTTLTDSSGYFTVSQELAPGDYQWRIKSSQSQANSGNVTLIAGSNLIEMGTLRMGDTNGDNCSNVVDFTVLRNTFGKTLGQPGFDDRADFDGDGLVNISDLTLLRAAYGRCGAPPICTPTPTPTPPPDPASVAPPIALDVPTDLGASTSFLYSGANPIQVGVVSGTIEMTRAAVLRGYVYTRDRAPLPGVVVEVLDHPELGHTMSRADGAYDLAVNGGGPLDLSYAKSSYLPAERKAVAPWQDFRWVDDVVLIPLDPNLTTISTLSSDPMQVARGSVISDTDGARQDTLMFAAGTSAIITLPNGISQTLNTYHVRSTEYTVGDSGPDAMPGALPPTSGYTQASEFSVDEAVATGATQVGFSRPVVSYLENFLEFPVGITVPVGYYDKSEARWIASDSGLVVTVLTATGGLAGLDIHGQGTPATPAELAALGVTDPERAKLALLYQPGQSVWRILVSHFSTWDRNMGLGAPDTAESPTGTPTLEPDEDKLDCQSGSIIGCQNQSLGEQLAITGAPFGLHYQSGRMPGYGAGRTLSLPLSGPTLPGPPTPTTIEVEIAIAGQIFAYSYPAVPNFTTSFTWNGRDAYGRTVQGCEPVTVRMGYTFPAVYTSSGRFASGGGGGPVYTIQAARQEIILWSIWHGCLGNWQAPPQDIGGWSVGVHHIYDLHTNTLFMGNGSKRSARTIGPAISLTGGNGTQGSGGDGGPATLAQMRFPTDAVIAPDGSRYIADQQNHRVRRIGTDGVITTVAGTGLPGFTGDGGPATQARLFRPSALALGPDASLYIADTDNNRIRKVAPDGTITTVAGSGLNGYSGDDGPATQARLAGPSGIAAALDGSLYIADTGNNRVRQVATDGRITTVAGTGTPGYSGDGGRGFDAQLYHPIRLAISGDGVLYIADLVNHRVRQLRPDGLITTVAGTGTPGYSGEGGPATEAQLNNPTGLALRSDGSLYIADTGNNRVRVVSGDGTIFTIAGNGVAGYNGETGPGGAATLNSPSGVTVGPDGVVYIADTFNSRVRQVAYTAASLRQGELVIPSEDGSVVYIFDLRGQHQRTVDALTGALIYRFFYDASGRLTDVRDGDNNNTHIARDQNGKPTSITGPYGQTTQLVVGANGYLSSVTNPANETVSFGYDAGGLLTSMRDARGGPHVYHYDIKGRLTYDQEPDGSYKSLSRVTAGNVYTVTVRTAMTRTTTYRVENYDGGAQRRVKIAPGGTRTEQYTDVAGNQTITYADGSTRSTILGPDPRWKMLAPIVTYTSYRTPGGLTSAATNQVTVRLAGSDPLALLAMTDTITINGRTFTEVYDAATSLITDTTPQGRKSFTTLNNRGRPTLRQTLGLGPSTYSYDSQGRMTGGIYGSGTGTRNAALSYNPQGYVAIVTDTLGTSASFGYDSAGRVLDQALPLQRTNRFTYDANSNLTSVQPPGQLTHTFDYTPANLRSSYTPPDAGGGLDPTGQTYNLDQQLTRLVQPGNITVTYGYDNRGRPSVITHPLGIVNLAFAPITSKLMQVSGSDGVTSTFGYDGALVTDSTYSGVISATLHHSYDSNFNLAAETVNGANSVSYSYNQDGLLMQAGALSTSRNTQNGLLTGTTLGGVTDTLGYNQFGEVTTYTAGYNGSNVLVHANNRDNAGRITQRAETVSGISHTFVYTYDVAHRLTDVSRDGLILSHYSYSPNGTRTGYVSPSGTMTGTYDTQDRLVQYGSLSFTYSPNGELQSKIDASTSQTTTYVYDALSNLRSATLPDGTQIEYVIDGQNRRVGKKVNGTLAQAFLYSGAPGPVAELDASGNVVSRFVYGTHANVPDYVVKSGQTYFIVSDNLGSPRLVVDTANGQIVQRMDYDEFGVVLTDTNPGFQPFGFAGGMYDHHTGLVRFRARDYDAETGRWTAKDPVRFSGGDTNLYSYAHQDPVNFVDPTGLWTLQFGGEAGGSLIAAFGLGGGVVIDGEGNVGIYATHKEGVNTVLAPSISAGFGLSLSLDSDTIMDAAGTSTEVSISVGAGPQVCTGYSQGDNSSFNLGIGLGAGIEAFVGKSHTSVQHIANVNDYPGGQDAFFDQFVNEALPGFSDFRKDYGLSYEDILSELF
jgi:RHS repeat-associated protein